MFWSAKDNMKDGYWWGWTLASIALILPIWSLLKFLVIRLEYNPQADDKLKEISKKSNLTDEELEQLYILKSQTKAIYLAKLDELFGMKWLESKSRMRTPNYELYDDKYYDAIYKNAKEEKASDGSETKNNK